MSVSPNKENIECSSEEDVASEILIKAKKEELGAALAQLISQEQDVVIWSKGKNKLSKSNRGSKYRGVSKNGKKWQVQLLGNLRKRYIGSIYSENAAARIYDQYAILTHGLKAKTNFTYRKHEIQTMLALFTKQHLLNPCSGI
jgi:hypothetical protein